MLTTLYANFADAANCEKALGALLDHGAEPADLSAFFPKDYQTPDVHEVQATVTHGVTTTTSADAAAGAGKGAGIGFGLGAVAALASLAIPGWGIITGGGALATAIGAMIGTTAAGAVTGGVAGFLEDQGVDKQIAADSEKALEHGEAVLVARVPSGKVTEELARELMVKYLGQVFGRVDQPVTTPL